MDELDKILGDQNKETPSDAGAKKPAENKEKDPEVLSKEQELANINKALAEAKSELKSVRKEIKGGNGDESEDPALKINLEDPNSKAWDKHITDKINPVAAEVEAEKQELFGFTFKDFVKTKPALAGNPEKMKQLIATYNRIKDNTGRVKEGILNDLNRAYAAENYEAIVDQRQAGRVDRARRDAIYSDAGVSRGASNYQQEHEDEPVYDDQDAAILAKWNMTPQEHAKMIADNKKAEQA